MKLLDFQLNVNEHTTDYTTVEKYLAKRNSSMIVPASEIIEKDFLAELYIQYETDAFGTGTIDIVSYDVKTLMDWVQENNPDLYALIPSFKVDQFEALARQMKASSHLSYNLIEKDVTGPEDLEYVFGTEPETDDFVPQMQSVNQSLCEIIKNGFYCELHCYPHTPIGFWNFYGLDFQSLLDHVTEE